MHAFPSNPITFDSHNSLTTSRSAEIGTISSLPRQSLITRRSKSSTMIVGSSSCNSACSHRAGIRQDYRRSLRYTRTLDVILEETSTEQNQQQEQHFYVTPNNSSQHLEQDNRSSCDSPTTTVLTTDFWHSMQSMKKSATSVSLNCLVGANDNSNNASEELNSGVLIEDDEGYDNFLDDWDL